MAALLAMGLAGCSVSPLAPPKPPRALSIPVSSEGGHCAGSVTFHLPAAWTTDGQQIARADIAKIVAFCDNKSRYLATDPGLEWNLDSVDHLTMGSVTRTGTTRLGDALATTWSAKTSSGWFGTVNTLSGDNYVSLQVNVRKGDPGDAAKQRYMADLETAVVEVQAQ